LLLRLRKNGVIPWDWIADNTRWMRKPRSWRSAREAVKHMVQSYRRDLWANQKDYVETWTEKDAAAGVILEITSPWDVPLMVSRGFSSATFLHEAAEAIKEINKPTYIYYFGDDDPSGVIVDQVIERTLREFAPEAEIYFQRVAVTREQIDLWQLPTRPTKRQGNTHAKHFRGDSVELDAIPPEQLQELVRNCIEQHVDKRALEVTRAAEKSEKELLLNFAKKLGKAI
jgi:hypothetical protein